jgi:hypothetical protein
VAQFDCHPEQAFFAQRGIWASRAMRRVLCDANNRAFGSLPYQTEPLPDASRPRISVGTGEDEKEARRRISPRLPTFAKNRGAKVSHPPELGAGWDACIASLGRPAAQEGIKALMARGFHKPGDVENRLGYYLGQIAR